MSLSRIILHVNDDSDGILALRAARYLAANPEKPDAILQYGGDGGPVVFARRNKTSITAYEQPIPPAEFGNNGADGVQS